VASVDNTAHPAHTAAEADQAGALAEMRAELAAMRAELHELQASNAARSTPVAPALHAEVASITEATGHRTNRRGMLRLAGAAAAGAAAAAVGQAGQAAATNGQALFIGTLNEATRGTVVSYGTAANGVTPGDDIGAPLTAMMTFQTNQLGSVALYNRGSLHGMVSDGQEDAYLSYNSNYTFHSAASRKSALKLSAIFSGPGNLPKTPPPTRTDLHFAGEMEVDTNGDLWWCVENGLPGTWRKLAGPMTAGAFHAISPARVYDSRFAEGPLGAGASRIVSIKDGRDGAGVVTTPDVVPVGATAIAYNITVADTVGGGFLAVAEGTSTGTSASSINWSASGQLLANGLQVKIDEERRVAMFSGGAGTTNFIIDVVGYYR